MADKSIAELAIAQQMTDDARTVVYQDGETKSIEGRLIKQYARDSVTGYVDEAKGSAEDAGRSAEAAKKSETAAGESAATAQAYSGKPPVIRDGTWWTWNADKQEYADTGSPAQGNLLYATFFVDPATGRLHMTAPDEYRGPEFALRRGHLEVHV